MVPLQRKRQLRGSRISGKNAGAVVGQALRLAAALVFGLSLGAAVASAEDTPGAGTSGGTLSVATWGGAYEQSQEIAYFEPFAKETGTSIATQIYDGSLAKIKAMIGGDASPVDVVDLSSSALGALCNDGLLETIEASSLGAAPSGESAEQDFFTGGLSSCGVASVAWSTAIAFDRQAFVKTQPSQIADLRLETVSRETGAAQ